MKSYYVVIFGVLLLVILVKILNKIFMFDLLMIYIFKHEGGYVNDPDDLGGETKYGIAKRYFPNEDIKNLTKERAKELYYQNYYVPLQVDKINDLQLAFQYFDCGVNCGIKNAKNMMIKAKLIKETSTDSLLSIFKELRREYYRNISELRNNKKYLKGWLNRVNTVVA